MRTPSEASKRERWQRLYDRLCSILSEFGVEDAYGDGDFFVVDDFYVDQQKVYITSWHMLERPFIGSISALVSGEFPEFEVLVQISARTSDGERCGARGVIVRSQGIEDCIDRSKLPAGMRDFKLGQLQ